MVILISLHGKRRVAYPGPTMSEVQSTFRLQPGDPGPSFELPDPNGQRYTLEGLRGEEGTLLVFACNHCPYVIHLASAVGRLAEKIAAAGISTAAIMPNDVENYPDDHPDKMGQFAAESGWAFPYLYDEAQEAARALRIFSWLHRAPSKSPARSPSQGPEGCREGPSKIVPTPCR